MTAGLLAQLSKIGATSAIIEGDCYCAIQCGSTDVDFTWWHADIVKKFGILLLDDRCGSACASGMDPTSCATKQAIRCPTDPSSSIYNCCHAFKFVILNFR